MDINTQMHLLYTVGSQERRFLHEEKLHTPPRGLDSHIHLESILDSHSEVCFGDGRGGLGRILV